MESGKISVTLSNTPDFAKPVLSMSKGCTRATILSG